MFSFSPFPFAFLSFLLHPIHQCFLPSIFSFAFLWCPDFMLAQPPTSKSKIYHLKHLDHFTSRRPSSPSSFSSSSSSSSSFCWYFPSVWPNGEECCQYILRALVAVYLLLFFTSSFLVFFFDHPTTCHCEPHHTPTQGPSPQHGVPPPNLGTTDSHCKSISRRLESKCRFPFVKRLKRGGKFKC